MLPFFYVLAAAILLLAGSRIDAGLNVQIQ